LGTVLNLASNSLSPRIEINSGVEADKAALEFTASIASAYRLSTSKAKIPELNSHIPGLDKLLKHKTRLRKLWQETRDSVCKKEFNLISKTIRCMTRKRALERWESKITNSSYTSGNLAYCEVLNKQGWTKGTNCYSRSFWNKISSTRKANAIADCLEKRFTPHDLCEKHHKRQVEAKVKDLEVVDINPLEKIKPSDL
jgi:hypothetical protein